MGVFDDRLKEKLLRDAKTLDKAIEIGQAYEASKSYMERIASAEDRYTKDIHVVPWGYPRGTLGLSTW